MSVLEMANQPIEISLGDRKLLVSRLGTRELYGPAESKIVSDYKANILSFAASLTGKEKIQYLVDAGKEIPKGSALLAAAQDYFGTPEGYYDLLMRGLNKHQKIDESEILGLICKATEEEKLLLIAYLMGTDYNTAKAALVETDEENAKKK